MAKQEFFTAIRRIFARDFTVAIQPDHPYLISGPDVLLGRNGVLVALFTPKAKEQQGSSSLLVRLTASRLALPTHTRCLLLLSKADEALGNNHVVMALFDGVFLFNPGRRGLNQDLIGFVKYQGREPTRVGREVVETQQRVFSRSSVLIRESQENLNLGGQRRRNEEQRSSWRSQEIIASLRQPMFIESAKKVVSERRNFRSPESDLPVQDQPQWLLWQRAPQSRSRTEALIERPEGLIGVVNVLENKSPMDKLNRFFDAAIQLEFNLDNGIPYLVWPAPKVLFVDAPPTYKLDPPKPVRVMAFSGWALAQVRLDEDPEAVSQRILSHIRGLEL